MCAEMQTGSKRFTGECVHMLLCRRYAHFQTCKENFMNFKMRFGGDGDKTCPSWSAESGVTVGRNVRWKRDGFPTPLIL